MDSMDSKFTAFHTENYEKELRIPDSGQFYIYLRINVKYWVGALVLYGEDCKRKIFFSYTPKLIVIELFDHI